MTCDTVSLTRGNRKSPFVKGDLEGFSTAQHDFDETLTMRPLPLTDDES
jgi:hypothetical protein